MWPLIGTQSSGGLWLAAGRRKLERNSSTSAYFTDGVVQLSEPAIRVRVFVWHDLASAPSHHPTESESELSVSGFLSVASPSCEEDEGRDTPLRSSPRRPSALRGPTGMSGEGNHGNQPAQQNGVENQRWDVLQL